MKNQLKWIIPLLALVTVVGVATLLYPHLSEKFFQGPEAETSGDAVPYDATEAYNVPVTESETKLVQKKYPAAESTTGAAETTTIIRKPYEPSTGADTKSSLVSAEYRAADFVVYDENGSAVRLSDHFGKPIVVNFWASWCGPCCSELPYFNAAAAQYDGQIEFMMVNLEDASSVRYFLENNGYTFPVYYDTASSGSTAYSVYSIPLTVFIRPNGTVMDSHIGSMNEYMLQNYLSQLLAS